MAVMTPRTRSWKIVAVMLAAAVVLVAAGILAGCSSPAGPAATPTAAGGSPTPAAAGLSASPAADTPSVAAAPTLAAAQPTLPPAAPTAAAPSGETPMPVDLGDPSGGPAPLPECRPPLAVTPPDTEGPYYLGDTPQRASLVEPGMPGKTLTMRGYVLRADCSPVPGARLDFWQADANGEYDLSGYTLRGHIFSADDGSYQIETILPAVYGGRPRHIHVKVDAVGVALTTQLYFPGDSPAPPLTVELQEAETTASAFFNFILP